MPSFKHLFAARSERLLFGLLLPSLVLSAHSRAQAIQGAGATTPSTPDIVAIDGLDGLEALQLSAPRAPKAAFQRFSEFDGLQLDGVAPTISLPALDLVAIRLEDAARAARFDKTLRYGIGRDVEVTFEDGLVIPLSDGSILWTVDLLFENAVGARLHLTDLHLPAGAQVIVYGVRAPELVAGPYEGLGQHDDGQLWTQTRPGDRLRVEYRIPDVKPEDDLADFGFRIDRVTHNYRDPVGGTGGDGDHDPGAGPCHNDVTCYASADLTKRAVGGIGFINSDALFCTGSLLNNLSGDFAPFWMTANHCLSTNSTAQSSEIYWRYETATCNAAPPSVASVPQSAVCTLLSTGVASDYTLLRIDGAIPSSQLYWPGWNTAIPANGTAGNCIHHPSGDFKRISFGTYSNTLGCGGGDHFRVNWTNGPTEPGSSGSPFFADGFGFIGQLHCGPSECGTATNDQYGSWNSTWPSVSTIMTAGAGDDGLEQNDTCATARFLTNGQYNGLIVKVLDDDWYRVFVGANQTLQLNATFTDAFGDIDLELYNSCGGSLVAAATSTTNNELLTYSNLGAGANFYLRVFLFDQDALANYSLGISTSPVNDACGNATLIADGVHSGALSGATTDGAASCGTSSASPDVWYRYTASCTGTLTVSTCGTHDGPGQDQGIDTVLAVFSGCGGTQLACNDDNNPQTVCSGLDNGTLRDSVVQIPVTVGQSVRIRVANFDNGQTGPFNLQVSCSPTNNSGTPFCSGSTGSCPCGAVGLVNQGCPNTNPNGRGAKLVGTGNAQFSSDTFGLQITDGAFAKAGIIIKGGNAVNYPFGDPTVPNSSGLFCVSPQQRGDVFFTNGSGAATVTVFQLQPFGATALPAGSKTYYQYWFRDPSNPCQNPPASVAAFNFSNAVEVMWVN